MKKITLLLLVILIGLPIGVFADSKINLTPVPMQMTVGEGKLILPESFTISTGSLEDELVAEATKFCNLFSRISGYNVSLTNDREAFITMRKYTGSEELGNEGYTLDITADGISITANSANGFYYAFQSKEDVARQHHGRGKRQQCHRIFIADSKHRRCPTL